MGISGRHPFTVDEAHYRTIRKCGKTGLSQIQTARCIGIGHTTWHEQIKLHPRMMEEYESGKAEGIAKVAGGLLANAIFPSEKSPGGIVAAQIAYLKHVAGWTDRTEVSGAPEAPLQVRITLPSNGRPVVVAEPGDADA